MEHLEWLLSLVANTAIIIFEFIGVGIIIYSGLTSFLKFLRRSPDTKIYLAKGLAMGLEFKMGSEILRTVVVREWKEIGIVAGIIALRAALTFLDSLGNQRRGTGRIRSGHKKAARNKGIFLFSRPSCIRVLS